MASESTGTHKDPVTGEMISKTYVAILAFALYALPHSSIPARSELKRREKAREKEAKKAERAAAAPPKPAAAAKSAAAEEEELNPNVCPLTFALAALYPPPQTFIPLRPCALCGLKCTRPHNFHSCARVSSPRRLCTNVANGAHSLRFNESSSAPYWCTHARLICRCIHDGGLLVD